MPPVSNEEPPAGEIDFWSSHPINWPALYALAVLMLGIFGLSLWVGAYGSAVSLALITAGSAALVYDGVLGHLGRRTNRRWYWAGLAIWGLVTAWNLTWLAAAWFTRGG